jgi:hypothetical protein
MPGLRLCARLPAQPGGPSGVAGSEASQDENPWSSLSETGAEEGRNPLYPTAAGTLMMGPLPGSRRSARGSRDAGGYGTVTVTVAVLRPYWLVTLSV